MSLTVLFNEFVNWTDIELAISLDYFCKFVRNCLSCIVFFCNGLILYSLHDDRAHQGHNVDVQRLGSYINMPIYRPTISTDSLNKVLI